MRIAARRGRWGSLIPWSLPVFALSCQQAPSVGREAPPTPRPAEASTKLPVATPATASAATSMAPREAHLPCPGHRADCTPMVPLVTDGVLDRAERYLEASPGAANGAVVRATIVRASAARSAERTQTFAETVEAALRRGSGADAAQAVADADGHVEPRTLERATRRVARRRGDVGGSCRTAPGTAVLVSPRSPRPGQPLRVLAVSEVPLAGARLVVEGSDGALTTPASAAEGGPPFAWTATLAAGERGAYRAVLEAEGVRSCRRFDVGAGIEDPHAWPVERGWSRDAENLYGAWLRHLFDVPVGTRFPGLSAVTEDPSRNLLHGHLGLGEDDPGRLALSPDCADHPFALRAYFAWKLRLPFVRHDCRLSTAAGEPACGRSALGFARLEGVPPSDHVAAAWDVERDADEPPPSPGEDPAPTDEVAEFRRFARALENDVHARSLRTAPADDRSDVYPVPLARDRLRPGVVYSDPYGHTLTLVRWIAQSEAKPGQLVAVDAQPDGTVAVKRFWRGTFVYTDATRGKGHGFKAFRPVVRAGHEWRPLRNDEIAVARGYGDVDELASSASASEFYGALARFINPVALDPEVEYRELHAALHEQLVSRVREVDLATDFVAPDGSRPLQMPKGRAVFRTTGPWEALSTPCRDLRLLVGLDVLTSFPSEATTDVAARARLVDLHQRLARELFIEYPRSDATLVRLTLADVLARRERFEAAYNPNDCPEVRWGAAEGSAELSTCTRRAPTAQRLEMDKLRHWFRKRYACG